MQKDLLKEDQLKLDSGTHLPVMEHFYTIQGEGKYTGVASYFLRLGGCDVGCHWCDVKESWDADKHPITSVENLIPTITKYCKTIVLTGGEPLMYNLNFLTRRLKEAGMRIHIETSGAYDLSGHIDWICLSPKKTMLPKASVLKKANELKCIIFNNSDFAFAEKFAEQVPDSCELYLQPEWSKRELMIPKIVDYVMANPKWRISLQTHKFLNIP